MVPLAMTRRDPLAKFLLLVPAALCSADQKVPVPEGGSTTMIPFSWKLRYPPDHFGLLMPLNKQAKKGVTMLAGVTDPDYQRKVGL